MVTRGILKLFIDQLPTGKGKNQPEEAVKVWLDSLHDEYPSLFNMHTNVTNHYLSSLLCFSWLL